MIKLRLALFLLLMLAACAPATPENVADLPTVAQLPSLTATLTLTSTVTPTATLTPSETPTPTITLTETASVTPSATITETASPTPTNTATATVEIAAVNLLADLAARATVLPQSLFPSVVPTQSGQVIVPTLAITSCPFPAPGGFAAVFSSDAALIGQIGCPQGAPPTVTTATSATQQFERGVMLWVSGPIYLLFSDGRYQRFDDTFVPGVDQESDFLVPPPGLLEPVRGFGKIWRTSPGVRDSIGWGIAPESGGQATIQHFDRGWMIDDTQRNDVLILVEDAGGLSGTWRAVGGGF